MDQRSSRRTRHLQSVDLEDTVSGVNCTLGDAVVFASDACNIVGPIGPRAKNNSHGIEVARLRFCALFQICHSVRIVNFDTKGVENIARDRANNSVGHQLGHITFKDARATRNRTSTSDLEWPPPDFIQPDHERICIVVAEHICLANRSGESWPTRVLCGQSFKQIARDHRVGCAGIEQEAVGLAIDSDLNSRET